MGRKVNVGDDFVRLTVTREAAKYHSPKGQMHRQVECKCVCGNIVIVRTSSLRSGLTISCGCLQREKAAVNRRNSATHGMDGTTTYKAWASMKQRCLNPKHEFFNHYGGRGIQVCDSWLESFKNFFADMGECPEGLTLDRIENDGNYEPANCRWATRFQQNSNRRNATLLTMDGETMCVSEWSRKTGIHQDTIRWRISRGWTVEDALTIPTRKLVTLRDDLQVPSTTKI